MASGVGAIEYHERTKHSPRSVGPRNGLDFDNKPRPYKVYEGLPTIRLEGSIPDLSMPALEALTRPQPLDRSTSVDQSTVAGVCHYAAGITKTITRHGHEHAFRAAACTGALYHIDLYAVCGDLEGTDAGVYHYDPRTDSLHRLRAGDFRGVLADAAPGTAIETAPVTIATTSTWWRNAWKYGARTYRHAFWDSGTILANLVTAASAVGEPAEVVPGFADRRVAELLGVDPASEAPLELVAIGSENHVPAARAVEPIDPPTAPLESDPVEYPLIVDAWTASTLEDGDAARRWRSKGGHPIGGCDPDGDGGVVLEPAGPETAPDRPLDRTVIRRGSCREYDRHPVSAEELATVLNRAVRGLPLDVLSPIEEDESGAPPALQLVDCYCLVNAIDGLVPGAYQYHPAEGRLEPLREGVSRREAGHLALDQRLGADAAVCIYFLADLEAVTARLGDRGYRAAQLEAAITAGRLYLATYAHRDLGGTGLTFYDDEVTEFFSPRAANQTPMFLYTLGRPA